MKQKGHVSVCYWSWYCFGEEGYYTTSEISCFVQDCWRLPFSPFVWRTQRHPPEGRVFLLSLFEGIFTKQPGKTVLWIKHMDYWGGVAIHMSTHVYVYAYVYVCLSCVSVCVCVHILSPHHCAVRSRLSPMLWLWANFLPTEKLLTIFRKQNVAILNTPRP